MNIIRPVPIDELTKVTMGLYIKIQTYLSLMDLKHGLLVNFKVPKMKEGIHRVFNNKGKEEL